MPRWLKFLARRPALVAAVAALLVGLAGLGLPFGWDDIPLLQENPAIQQPAVPLHTWFSRDHYSVWPEMPHYRPLAAAGQRLAVSWLGMEPWAHRAFTLAFHAAASALVAWLAMSFGLGGPGAVVAGLIFAVHPVHSEVLLCAAYRSEAMAAVGVLGALWLFRTGRPRWSLAAYAAALACGEAALSFPLILLVSEREAPHHRRWRAQWMVWSVTAAYLLFRAGAVRTWVPPGWARPELVAPELWMPLTAITILIPHALALLAIPVRLCVDWVPQLAGEVEAWRVVLGVALAGGAAWGLAALRTRRLPFLIGLWWPLTWAPGCGLWPFLGTWQGEERGLYLASAGVCWAAAWAVEKRGWVKTGLTVALVLAGRTLLRTADWRSSESLGNATIAVSPGSVRAHGLLGRAYLAGGKNASAEEELRRALALDPGHLSSLGNLAALHRLQGKADLAASELSELVRRAPRNYQAWYNLGNLRFFQKRYTEAAAAFQHAIEVNPSLVEALEDLGGTFLTLNRLEDARKVYERAVVVSQESFTAHYGLGQIHEHQGRMMDAMLEYERALAVRPNEVRVSRRLLALRPRVLPSSARTPGARPAPVPSSGRP